MIKQDYEKTFVDKTIEIHASASKVWDVLTKSEYADQWTSEFTGGEPFTIESDCKLGSPMLWKDKAGIVRVEGNVTALQQHKLLRYTSAMLAILKDQLLTRKTEQPMRLRRKIFSHDR